MPIAPEYLHLVHPTVESWDCYLYGRNSREQQKNKGRSVGDQLTEARSLANRFDWPVVREFTDAGISASRHARKSRDDFEAMIEGILNRECRIVVAFEASRYYRDLEVYVRLRNACHEAGVLLCYNGQVYDLSKREDRKATAMDALQAEDEAEGIRDRNLRTARLLADKGAPYGRIPEGYARRYDPDTGELIEQIEHPERGPIITEVFRRFDAGEGMIEIVRDLRERGLRNQRGGEWELHHLRHVLRNRTYIGRRVRRGEDIGPGQWPALTDEATFFRVQQQLRDRDKRKTRNVGTRWMLSGIAECGPCEGDNRLGVRMNRERRYYTCQTCFRVVMEMRKFDAYVEEGLLRWLSSPEAAAAFQSDGESRRAAGARQKRDQLVAQLAEARELAATFDNGKPRLSVSSLAALEAALTPQIEAAQAAAEVAGLPPIVRDLVGRTDCDAVWERMTLTQQRAVLRAVVNIRLNSASRNGVRSIEPGRITMTYVGQPGFRS